MANHIIPGQPCLPHSGCDLSAPDVQDTQCHGAYTLLRGTADTIPFPGSILVSSAGVNSMTLPTPIAGEQRYGGDDGKTVFVISNTAQAHSITTPTNGIIGSRHLATFTAGVGNNITLMAMNGTWVVRGTALGVTVS